MSEKLKHVTTWSKMQPEVSFLEPLSCHPATMHDGGHLIYGNASVTGATRPTARAIAIGRTPTHDDATGNRRGAVYPTSDRRRSDA